MDASKVANQGRMLTLIMSSLEGLIEHKDIAESFIYLALA
jgi:hypothetical protein